MGKKLLQQLKMQMVQQLGLKTVPSGFCKKKEISIHIVSWSLLSLINVTIQKYYSRYTKRFDDSTDTTVELIDKTTVQWLKQKNYSDKVVFKNSLLLQQHLIVN